MAKSKHESLVGIDVSAKTLQVAMIGVDGHLEEMTFSNDAAGHRALIARLTKRGRSARIGLEATGNYSLDLLLVLSAQDRIQVMQVNPRAARRFADAQMQRAKTDLVDARLLLDFVKRMDFVPWVPPSDEALALRSLARQLHGLKQAHVAEQNRLHAAEATAATHPTVLEDLRLGLEQLAQRIDRMEQAALALIQGSERLSQLHRCATSIRGIGDRAAIYLLGELVLLPDDMSPRELVAHAGLDPRPRQSGTTDKRRSISKLGNRRLRSALFMPAMVAAQREPAICAFYKRLLQNGKRPIVAIVAVMRRLLSTLWVMLRSGEVFQPERFSPAVLPSAA